jgi:hypothetical protein
LPHGPVVTRAGGASSHRNTLGLGLLLAAAVLAGLAFGELRPRQGE